MNGFEMTTDINNIPISGSQKAAVLFTELGSSVTTQMLSYFSDYELKKLRQAVGKLGAYSPKKSNFAKVQQREIRVLEDACKFGIKKRFLAPSKGALKLLTGCAGRSYTHEVRRAYWHLSSA